MRRAWLARDDLRAPARTIETIRPEIDAMSRLIAPFPLFRNYVFVPCASRFEKVAVPRVRPACSPVLSRLRASVFPPQPGAPSADEPSRRKDRAARRSTAGAPRRE